MSMKIVLCGPKGIGKSSLGKKISSYLNLKFIDLDEKVKNDYQEIDILKDLLKNDSCLISTRWKTILDKSILEFLGDNYIIVLMKAKPSMLWSRLKYRKALLDMPEDISYDEFIETVMMVYESVEKQADLIFEIEAYRRSGIHRKIGNLIVERYKVKLNKLNIYNEVPLNTGQFNKPVITIGNFDGVHRGHKKIIETLLNRADEVSGEPFVLTFNSHPREFLNPGMPCRIITTVNEKIKAIHNLGVNNIILLDLDEKILNLTAWEFYKELLIERLGVNEIVIGYDHHFGKNREGNYEYLLKVAPENDVVITRVEKEVFGENIVSSTLLRERIDNGEVVKIAELLGRRYSISGKIVHGEGRGKKLGAPTANIELDLESKITPAYGVYAVEIEFEDSNRFKGVMNIGENPTFSRNEKSIEVHIFDFEDEIYGDSIKVEFVEKIRNEIKFSNSEDLMKKIQEDVQEAKRILN